MNTPNMSKIKLVNHIITFIKLHLKKKKISVLLRIIIALRCFPIFAIFYFCLWRNIQVKEILLRHMNKHYRHANLKSHQE